MIDLHDPIARFKTSEKQQRDYWHYAPWINDLWYLCANSGGILSAAVWTRDEVEKIVNDHNAELAALAVEEKKGGV